MVTAGESGGKTLNFDLNLLPIISILAVCVCFLLTTAVWIPIGQVSIEQGLGEKFTGSVENPPTVFASLNNGGDVVFMLKDLSAQQQREQRVVIGGFGAKIDWQQVTEKLNQIRKTYPQIQTGIVMPNTKSKYDEVMQMMDRMRQAKISSVGLSPF